MSPLTIKRCFNKAGFPDSHFEIDDPPASANSTIGVSTNGLASSIISDTVAAIRADLTEL